MTKGQYPTIEQGLGNLSPDLWNRIMRMLLSFETKDRDETSKEPEGSDTIIVFPAILAKAKCIDPNRYIYSWSAIQLTDANGTLATVPPRTSEGDNDEWDYAALNLMEIPNTATYAAPGVDMSADTYPSGYTLQAIGGGSCTGTGCEFVLDGLPVVMVFKISGRETETVARYVFCATNEHDGACGATMLTIDDPIDSDPSATTEKAHIYVDDSDGDLKVIFADGTVKTIVVDT